MTPEIRRSEAAALTDTVDVLLAIGDTAGALAAAEQARQIMTDLLAGSPASTTFQRPVAVSYEQGRRRAGGARRPGQRA